MIISLCNQKGGVAKTTTVINLAHCLSEFGYSVLCIDCDPQRNLSIGVGFDTEGKKTLHDLLVDDKVNIHDTIHKTEFGFSLIPADISLANAEVELATMFCREQILSDKLKDISSDYDYILIDCNPAIGFITLNSLVAADKVIIPVEPAEFSIEGLINIKDLIDKIRLKLNSKLDIMGILFTIVNKNTNLSKKYETELTRIFGDKVFKTVIHKNVKIPEAQSEHMPIGAYNKHCTGYKEYNELAKEICKWHNQQ